MMAHTSIQIDQLRRRELLRSAEAERLAREARPLSRRPMRAFRPLLRWAGRGMVAIGHRLLAAAKEWEHQGNTVYNGASTY